MKRWRFTQSEIHVRTVLVEAPDSFRSDDVYDFVALGHEKPGISITEDETEYSDTREDAIVEEVA